MKLQNLLPLFLILLIASFPILNYANAEPIINYQNLTWIGNSCASEFSQSRIEGVFPTQIANVDYRPQSTTICIKNVHGFNGTDYGFHIKVFQTIDYATYVMTVSPSGGANTSIFKVNGALVGAIGYNTSFTHVSNNVYLAGIMDHTSTTYDEGQSQAGWGPLGVSSCTDFTTLTGDIFHEFVYQVKNDTTPSFAFELFIDGNFWCTYTLTTSQNPFRTELGHTDDNGLGAGTGNLNSRYREYEMTPGRHLYSLQLAGLEGVPVEAPPPAFGEGDQTTFSILTAEDDRGNLRDQYAESESIVFDASLQFVNDTSGLVQDAPVGEIINFFRFEEFFDEWEFIGQAPLLEIAGKGPRARLPYVHIDSIMPTTDFRANYTGNQFQNLSATISNIRRIITIEDAQIPLSIGTRLSPPSVEGSRTGTIQDPLEASNIVAQNIFSHGEPFRVSAFLTRIDTGATLAQQRVFLQMDINATGNWVHFQTLETNVVGRATSEFRIWDTRFIGEQRFRFVYFASAPFINSTSVNGTAFVASTASDFRLTIELIPSTVLPGDRVEIRGQLTNIASNQFGTPMPNERIIIFVSSFDKTAFFDIQLTSNSRIIIRTDANGLYSHMIFGPNIGGASSQTMDFFANSSINSVVATSANATLTINTESVAPPQEIVEVQPTNFLLFSFLIDNPKANCPFPDPKTCSTMSWMTLVFIISSILAMVSIGLRIPAMLAGIGWIFLMLGGLIMGVAVGAVLELLLFIGALPVIVVLITSIGAIIRMKGSGTAGAVDTA